MLAFENLFHRFEFRWFYFLFLHFWQLILEQFDRQIVNFFRLHFEEEIESVPEPFLLCEGWGSAVSFRLETVAQGLGGRRGRRKPVVLALGDAAAERFLGAAKQVEIVRVPDDGVFEVGRVFLEGAVSVGVLITALPVVGDVEVLKLDDFLFVRPFAELHA